MKKLTRKIKRTIAQWEHDQCIKKVASDPDFFPCRCRWNGCPQRGHEDCGWCPRSATLRLGWSEEFVDLDLLIQKSDTSSLLPDRIRKVEDVGQLLKQGVKNGQASLFWEKKNEFRLCMEVVHCQPATVADVQEFLKDNSKELTQNFFDCASFLLEKADPTSILTSYSMSDCVLFPWDRHGQCVWNRAYLFRTEDGQEIELSGFGSHWSD